MRYQVFGLKVTSMFGFVGGRLAEMLERGSVSFMRYRNVEAGVSRRHAPRLQH